MKSKKAQFEVSLNWVYVIIVGVFVIFLFTKISSFTIKKSEFDSSEKIASYFNNIISELFSTYNQQGKIDLENIEFKIIEEEGYSKIKYKNKISSLKSIVFSPKSLKGKISYWSYGYKKGVLSNKILLLSDERYHIIFYYDDSDGSKYFKELLLYELPENYNEYFKIIFTNNIDRYVNLKYKKIVCLNLDENFCDIKIKKENNNKIFYKKENSDEYKEFIFYEPNFIFLSSFSSSEKYFEDTLKLIEKKHNFVIDIFIEKTELLKKEAEENNKDICVGLYDNIKNDFENLKSNTITQQQYENIKKDLEEKNNLLFRNNCKTIY